MKFDLNNAIQRQTAIEQFKTLLTQGSFIDISEVNITKSIDQNALYWVWLNCLEAESGYNKYELHLLYRALLLQKEESEILESISKDTLFYIGNMLTDFRYFPELRYIIDVIAKSTSDLNTNEFSNYLNNIRNHARVYFNVILIHNDESEFIDFFKEYGFR